MSDKIYGVNADFPPWMGPLPRVCSPWSEAEEEVLAAEFNSQYTLEEIARNHGRAVGAIRSRLARLGFLEDENAAMPGASALEQEVAELRRKVQMLNQTVYGNRNRWKRA